MSDTGHHKVEIFDFPSSGGEGTAKIYERCDRQGGGIITKGWQPVSAVHDEDLNFFCPFKVEIELYTGPGIGSYESKLMGNENAVRKILETRLQNPEKPFYEVIWSSGTSQPSVCNNETTNPPRRHSRVTGRNTICNRKNRVASVPARIVLVFYI